MSCKICNHMEREEIERDYVSGVPLETLSMKYDISERTLHHHLSEHTTIRAAASEITKINSEIPQLSKLRNSDQIRLASIFTLCKSIDRLNIMAEETGSVKAEATLATAISTLNGLMKGLDFDGEPALEK